MMSHAASTTPQLLGEIRSIADNLEVTHPMIQREYDNIKAMLFFNGVRAELQRLFTEASDLETEDTANTRDEAHQQLVAIREEIDSYLEPARLKHYASLQ